jgi:hypothetical protein
MLAGFIACAYVTVITLFGQIPAAPMEGVVEVGAGAGTHGFAPVVKVHIYGAARLFPYRSLTAVVRVPVYVVLSASAAFGAKTACFVAAE